MIRQFGEIVRIVIHVVTGTDLRRPPVAAPIVCDHTVAALEEEDHLRVPIVGRERPSVMEDDWLSGLRTPILVENSGPVLGGDRAHVMPLPAALMLIAVAQKAPKSTAA